MLLGVTGGVATAKGNPLALLVNASAVKAAPGTNEAFIFGGSSFDKPFVSAVAALYDSAATSAANGSSYATYNNNNQAWVGTGTTGSATTCPVAKTYESVDSAFGRSIVFNDEATVNAAGVNCTADNYKYGQNAIGFSDIPTTFDPSQGVTYPSDNAQAAALEGVSGFTGANSSATTAATQTVEIPVTSDTIALIINNSFATGTPAICNKVLKKQGLHLTGAIIGGIFAGTITSWDASSIQAANTPLSAANSGTALAPVTHDCLADFVTPGITPIVREPGSGTTFIFSTYLLGADSAQWSSTASASASTPPFLAPTANLGGDGSPTQLSGAGGTGAEVSTVKSTAGGIGYVGGDYVLTSANATSLKNAGVFVGRVLNTAGKALPPTITGLKASVSYALGSSGTIGANAGHFGLGSLSRFNVTNQACAKCYPIVGFSYAIVQAVQPDQKSAVAIAKFLYFMSHGTSTLGGQAAAPALFYGLLTPAVENFATSQLQNISYLNAPTGFNPLAASL